VWYYAITQAKNTAFLGDGFSSAFRWNGEIGWARFKKIVSSPSHFEPKPRTVSSITVSFQETEILIMRFKKCHLISLTL
jgi:hypothetical protein